LVEDAAVNQTLHFRTAHDGGRRARESRRLFLLLDFHVAPVWRGVCRSRRRSGRRIARRLGKSAGDTDDHEVTQPRPVAAHTVAQDNLGEHAGLLSATALMIDYVLTAAVGMSVGVVAAR
jgi:hypothetical protein